MPYWFWHALLTSIPIEEVSQGAVHLQLYALYGSLTLAMRPHVAGYWVVQARCMSTPPRRTAAEAAGAAIALAVASPTTMIAAVTALRILVTDSDGW